MADNLFSKPETGTRMLWWLVVVLSFYFGVDIIRGRHLLGFGVRIILLLLCLGLCRRNWARGPWRGRSMVAFGNGFVWSQVACFGTQRSTKSNLLGNSSRNNYSAVLQRLKSSHQQYRLQHLYHKDLPLLLTHDSICSSNYWPVTFRTCISKAIGFRNKFTTRWDTKLEIIHREQHACLSIYVRLFYT